MNKKKLAAAALLIASGLTTQAKMADTISTIPMVPSRANELGLVVEQQLRSVNDVTNFALGIQYKHWTSQNLGVRASALYVNSKKDMQAYDFRRATADTVIEYRKVRNLNIVQVGAGVEAQRQFYKSIYFFAAAELRVGYGTGGTDTQTVKRFNDGYRIITQDGTAGRGSELSVFHMGFVPSVGVKVQFSRISCGLELFNNFITATALKEPGYSTANFDVNFGDISQRFFLYYRF